MEASDKRIPVCEIKREPNASLVQLLENLVEEAKNGELLGIAYIGQWKGDLVSSSWNLSDMHARKIVGEIEFLKRDLMERVD